MVKNTEKASQIMAQVESEVDSNKEQIAKSFIHYLYNSLGREIDSKAHYLEHALVYTIRDRLMINWKKTEQRYAIKNLRKGYYLSMEFLIGRSLTNSLINLGLKDITLAALYDLGLNFEEIEEAEHDAGLGNGGLGRLAACFMDSCATLALPVMGYGLRYEYGMFRQHIKNGYQVEEPDQWLRHGYYPWGLMRREYTRVVKFGGRTVKSVHPDTGRLMVKWEDTCPVLAVPFDVPVPGFSNNVVNTLRLWSAAAVEAFNLNAFNAGSYASSVAEKNNAESITMVLYPNDASENGKELRLKQQYFLVSASLQDIVVQWAEKNNNDFTQFAENNTFQLNDTHPSLAIAELMRLLMDEYELEWQDAWEITSKTMAYTNHTLLPEALEKWHVSLFERLLPRLLEVIYEINKRFLNVIEQKWSDDISKQRELSIIDEDNMVRMAHLAIVGSYSVNGVAELHSQLLKESLFKTFYDLWPQKFNNKTNGVTQRRWLAVCNPELKQLLEDKIGGDWIVNLDELKKIEAFAEESAFCERWEKVRLANKKRLANYIKKETGVEFDPSALFDVQVKRIHEYKRQLLNILHVIHLYNRIKRGQTQHWTNRCVIIGGKAAPGYYMAKLIIKLINNVADRINHDLEVGDKLKVVFLPNYSVSAMEVICAGTDLSEQISTAGKEASGTGNMKFMMNGAITIGTLDGANVEILEEVGNENFFLFGLKTAEVSALRKHYNPEHFIQNNNDLKQVMDRLESGFFNEEEPNIFDSIIGSLKSPYDPWMTLADFADYLQAQQRAANTFQNKAGWIKMSIINCARSGRFSSDRTIRQYNDEIWKLSPVGIDKT
ncbi:glycogen/starch/alpha-glucan phosphorylase [Caedibacter taeniospiralis]|uniref:glycogen/starch/alpha-glucan phosphorylase n=1 Tax=Caedibacter taeniospiralis TaxID=28907 RepID=UPI000C27DCEF|nr:glycogen/starch/alpha-glucan phosphorylase [Caedibacter taeniospiralis]